MSFLTVLPLALVMIAGPQIIAATLLATGHDARRNSLAFLGGAALAVTAGTMVAYWVTGLLERAAGPSGQGAVKTAIDWLVLALFVFLMVRTYRRRKAATTPKWMGRLQSAGAGFSFRLGLLLFLVMPTDIITMLTVGASLTRHGQPWWQGLPFVAVTLLLVALPLIDLLLLGTRAEKLLPRVRDWMTSNSWVISELVLAFFLVLTVSSLLS
jgi:Sap, sulfolipid-1-addressing protein